MMRACQGPVQEQTPPNTQKRRERDARNYQICFSASGPVVSPALLLPGDAGTRSSPARTDLRRQLLSSFTAAKRGRPEGAKGAIAPDSAGTGSGPATGVGVDLGGIGHAEKPTQVMTFASEPTSPARPTGSGGGGDAGGAGAESFLQVGYVPDDRRLRAAQDWSPNPGLKALAARFGHPETSSTAGADGRVGKEETARHALSPLTGSGNVRHALPPRRNRTPSKRERRGGGDQPSSGGGNGLRRRSPVVSRLFGMSPQRRAAQPGGRPLLMADDDDDDDDEEKDRGTPVSSGPLGIGGGGRHVIERGGGKVDELLSPATSDGVSVGIRSPPGPDGTMAAPDMVADRDRGGQVALDIGEGAYSPSSPDHVGSVPSCSPPLGHEGERQRQRQRQLQRHGAVNPRCNQEKRLVHISVTSFAVAVLSFILVIGDSELCYRVVEAGDPLPVTASAVLKAVGTIVTLTLQGMLWRYYHVKVAILKSRHLLPPGSRSTVLGSKYRYQFVAEALVCGLHVPPFLAPFGWSAALGPVVFVRLYLAFRVLVYMHPMFRYKDKARLAAMAAFNQVRVDALFVVKTLLRLQPLAVLVSAICAIVLFGAYAMEVFERTSADGHTGPYYWRWLRGIAGQLVGLEPPQRPTSVPGQMLEFGASCCGVLLLAVLIAIVSQKLELRTSEARVVEYLSADLEDRHIKNIAVVAIQHVWRAYARRRAQQRPALEKGDFDTLDRFDGGTGPTGPPGHCVVRVGQGPGAGAGDGYGARGARDVVGRPHGWDVAAAEGRGGKGGAASPVPTAWSHGSARAYGPACPASASASASARIPSECQARTARVRWSLCGGARDGVGRACQQQQRKGCFLASCLCLCGRGCRGVRKVAPDSRGGVGYSFPVQHALQRWRDARGKQQKYKGYDDITKLSRDMMDLSERVANVNTRVNGMERSLQMQHDMLARLCERFNVSPGPSVAISTSGSRS